MESETAKLRAFMLVISKNEHKNVVASEGIITRRCLKSPLKASAVKYGSRCSIFEEFSKVNVD